MKAKVVLKGVLPLVDLCSSLYQWPLLHNSNGLFTDIYEEKEECGKKIKTVEIYANQKLDKARVFYKIHELGQLPRLNTCMKVEYNGKEEIVHNGWDQLHGYLEIGTKEEVDKHIKFTFVSDTDYSILSNLQIFICR